ncbi:conserved protein of unknown function [Rhodovastum atsumiense]|uniref:DUF2063 domain-containing protein n=1 Tax=Rhodovastum atsumiense TaxID=504468 RepID=A0A5M6IR83_9PROT|nr:DNA-binding domain-containing protein [Rhodovastum atsumiense]KAA5610681.1 DUF2063 domain-containing protein [Rhodovastum atsumiense]CAH2603324.1 conserved protein of unknown function [Rhodovastum atsumiense]
MRTDDAVLSRRAVPCFAALLAPGLTDPTLPPPANLTGPRGKGAVRRYNVHRNNVTVSLIDALAAIFPATQRLTGPDFFRAMARFHIRATPPRSPLLFEYGRDFPAFIEGYEYARPLPWLADVARLERAWLDAYHAAEAPALRAGALAAIAAPDLETLRFVPHPASRVLRSPFPALSLFVMNRNDGPPGPLAAFVAEDALVTRPDQDVMVRHLPPGGAPFLARLLAGATLGEAAEAGFAAAAAFDLAGNIAGMITAGVFAAIRDGGS